MGIHNIHILTEPEMKFDDLAVRQAQAAQQEIRIAEHRRGMHPWGSMRRDCPLCQAGK